MQAFSEPHHALPVFWVRVQTTNIYTKENGKNGWGNHSLELGHEAVTKQMIPLKIISYESKK